MKKRSVSKAAYSAAIMFSPWRYPTRDELEAVIEADRADALHQAAGTGVRYHGLGSQLERTPDDFPYCQRRPYRRRRLTPTAPPVPAPATYRVQLADRLHAIMPPPGVPSPAPRDFLIAIAELAHSYKQSLNQRAVVVYSDLMNASEYRGRR
jgi:hypothetical protein